MNTKLMFSSKTDDWATPQEFFDKLNEEFCFDLDPCADKHNHKCETYFTKEMNGLEQSWGGIAYFATLLMEEKSENGWKKPPQKQRNQTQRSLCLFRQEQTLPIFMNISMRKTRRYGLSEVGSSLEIQRPLRPSLQWS